MEHNNILDHEQTKTFQYYNRSIRFLIFAFGLFIFSMLISMMLIFFGLGVEMSLLFLVLPMLASFGCASYGFYAAIQSFCHHEDHALKKFGGLVGNALFVLLFLGLILISFLSAGEDLSTDASMDIIEPVEFSLDTLDLPE